MSKLDVAIVTHRHKDHQHGMVHVLYNIPVDLFVGNTDDCPNRTGDDNVPTAIDNKSVSTHTFDNAPHVTTIDGVTFTIFPLPPKATCPEHENLNSIVVRMDYGDFSMLFTGDAEEDYLSATNDRVYCTNKHGPVKVYGFDNGNSRIYKQNNIDKSCVYDSTHY